MPRKHYRARKRAQKKASGMQQLRADFEANRKAPPALVAMLKQMSASDQCVWDILRSFRGDLQAGPDEEELVMLAQTAARPLAGMTPGNVLRRRARGG